MDNMSMTTDFNAFIGVWPYWENPYADSSGEGLIRLMDKHGIKRGVIVSLRAVFDDIRLGNDEAFKAGERFRARTGSRFLPHCPLQGLF